MQGYEEPTEDRPKFRKSKLALLIITGLLSGICNAYSASVVQAVCLYIE